MLDQSNHQINELIESFDSPDPGVSRQARATLTAMRDKVVLPLLQVYRTAGPDLRVKIYNLLHEPSFFQSLIRTLPHTNSVGRRFITTILGESGSAQAIEPIITAVRADYSEFRSRYGEEWPVAEYIGEFSSFTDALVQIGVASVLPLLRTLDDAIPVMRAWALSTLEALRDPRTVNPLIDTLDDPSPEVRSQAIATLHNFTRMELIPSSQALDALICMLDDPSKEVRSEAMETFLLLGGEYLGN